MRRFLIASFCLLIVGCGKARLTRDPVAAGDESDEPQAVAVPGPQVSDDPAEIARVRSQYEQELNSLYTKALAEVRKSDWLLSESEWALKERQTEAKAALERIMNAEQGETDAARARAAHALMQLDDPAGEPFLLQALRSPRSPLRAAALGVLGRQFDPKTSLNEPERARALLALLDDEDPEIVKKAAFLCARRKPPGAEARLLALLQSGRAKEPKEVALDLAHVAETPEAAQAVIQAALANRPAEYEQRVGFTLDRLVDHPDPKVSQPVRSALRAYLLGFQGEASYDQSLARDLAKVADASCIPALNEIAARARDPASRGYAQEGLARLDPKHAVERILDFCRRERAFWMIDVLQKYATEQDAGRILAVLLEPGPDSQPARLSLDATRLCLERLGAPGRAAIKKSWDHLDHHARMWALWKLNGLNLDRAIDDLHAAGVIAMDRPSVMARLRQSKIDPSDPDTLIAALAAADVLTIFDAESDEIPSNHHRLLFQFAEGSGGRFRIECPVQVMHQRDKDDDEGPYTVSFLHQGRLYRFGARNLGDWYDVEAVQNALNFTLKTTGRRERFIPLETGGQEAAFVFADPDAFLPVAARYGLPLSDDAGQAMQKGKEFERQVLEQLQKPK